MSNGKQNHEDRKRKLDEATAFIQAHKGRPYQVGQTLVTVQTGKLYKADFPTFEEYGRTRCDMDRKTLYNYIWWVEVEASIAGECARTGTDYQPVTSLEHARELKPAPAEQRRQLWEQSQAKATTEATPLTGPVVKEVVREAKRQRRAAVAREAAQAVPTADAVNKAIRCADILKRRDIAFIKDGSVDLVICSPPYGLGVRYGVFNDTMSRPQYMRLMRRWIRAIIPKLNPKGGRLCINVPEFVHNHEGKHESYVYRIGHKVCDVIEEAGLNCLGGKVWNKELSSVQANKWGSHLMCSHPSWRRQTERVYVFARGTAKRSHKPELQDFTSYQKDGWEAMAVDYCYINPNPEHRNYNHDATFPEKLPAEIMRFWGQKTDLVWDPFGGIGDTAIACVQYGRRFISTDIDPDYTAIARQRVTEELAKPKEGDNSST